MQIKHLVVIVLGLVTGACAKDANSVLNNAQGAMGNPKSIQYSGTGMNAFFGQALTSGKEWPRRDLTSYTRTINYDQKSSKEEMSFAQLVFGVRSRANKKKAKRYLDAAVEGRTARKIEPPAGAATERGTEYWEAVA